MGTIIFEQYIVEEKLTTSPVVKRIYLHEGVFISPDGPRGLISTDFVSLKSAEGGLHFETRTELVSLKLLKCSEDLSPLENPDVVNTKQLPLLTSIIKMMLDGMRTLFPIIERDIKRKYGEN